MKMNLAALGIGSNMGAAFKNLQGAVSAVALLPGTKVQSTSGVYRSAPIGFAQQPDFFNACILVETTLPPEALLGACLGIEAAMGRERQVKNGPRVIDIDLLFYENELMASHHLTLPHPRALERHFVLRPLMDIFPSGVAFGINIHEHCEKVSDQAVEKTSLVLSF